MREQSRDDSRRHGEANGRGVERVHGCRTLSNFLYTRQSVAWRAIKDAPNHEGACRDTEEFILGLGQLNSKSKPNASRGLMMSSLDEMRPIPTPDSTDKGREIESACCMQRVSRWKLGFH